MRSKISNRFLGLSVVLLAFCSILGCAAVQKVAEVVTLQTGDERLSQAIHAGSNLIAGLLPIGYEEENTIGQAIALQVVARYGGIYDPPELTRYINLVGGAVALTCDRPDIPYHFAVLNHDSINAFATPAGYVFVTRGLLKTLQSEAELAAVLGHEIAHVSQNHILEIIQRNKQIAGIAEAGLAYAGQDPSVFQHLIDTATTKLLDEGLDQSKELESDQLGAIFAGRVGYDSHAALTMLERLRKIKGDDEAFFKTHPNFSARIQAVIESLEQERSIPRGALVQERFVSNITDQI